MISQEQKIRRFTRIPFTTSIEIKPNHWLKDRLALPGSQGLSFDISGGGLSFHSEQDFPEGCQLSLGFNRLQGLNGFVKVCNQPYLKDGEYWHHCRFENIDLLKQFLNLQSKYSNMQQ